MSDEDTRQLARTAEALLENHALCDSCLGRQFAWLGTGTTNTERGHSLKTVLMMAADLLLKENKSDRGNQLVEILAENGMFRPAQLLAQRIGVPYSERTCCLCTVDGRSAFEGLDDVAQKIVTTCHDLEYDTFLVGSVPSPELADREDEIRSTYQILHGETLKSDINRELGKKLASLTDKPVDFDRPDVVFLYDIRTGRFSVQINPRFISGRYQKLARGIPQSRWDCTKCRGKGCVECSGTGRRYPDSISEYIGIPTQRLLEGTRFKFHAAGREDVDVLMLGSGRPFVVEVSEPKKRHIDLSILEEQINSGALEKVQVTGLAYSEREEAQSIKEKASENVKEYDAVIETGTFLAEEDLRAGEEALHEVDISQWTPTRVTHRRSDLERRKHIYQVRLVRVSDCQIKGFFRVQGGTYIKELISGDNGRTTPSLSEVLGTPCLCTQLNVTAIYGHETDHNA
jgi:tRNA pseudouridine synthase 10